MCASDTNNVNSYVVYSILVYNCILVCVYIYIYRERERDSSCAPQQSSRSTASSPPCCPGTAPSAFSHGVIRYYVVVCHVGSCVAAY